MQLQGVPEALVASCSVFARTQQIQRSVVAIEENCGDVRADVAVEPVRKMAMIRLGPGARRAPASGEVFRRSGPFQEKAAEK